MNYLYAIHRVLWLVGGYLLSANIAEKPKDWKLWAVLVCMFGMTLAAVFMVEV
jgi:hypothetical protein